MGHPYLLIVHPDEMTRGLLRAMLQGLNYQIVEAPGYRIGAGMIGHDTDVLVLAGIDPSDREAMEFQAALQYRQPQVPWILLHSGPSCQLTSQALRNGAAAVLRFPLPATQIQAAVIHALDRPAKASPGSAPDGRSTPPQGAGKPVDAALVGNDPGVRQALDLARVVAATRNPVLIEGEAGTGKSLLARIIHELSPRRNGSFIEVSRETLDESLLEEVLFGHPRDRREVGPFGRSPEAHGGTLVVDDVTPLSLAFQLKLQTLVRNRPADPPASRRTDGIDIRLIISSRREPSGDPEAVRFWRSISTRCSLAVLRLPPLERRGADVLHLAEHFLSRAVKDLGRGPSGFSSAALERLGAHSWPGNVAELKSVVKEAVSNCPGPRIEPNHLRFPTPRELSPALPNSSALDEARERIRPLRDALAEPERLIILRALQAWNWNRPRVAEVLEINRATLDKKMKQHGLLTNGNPVFKGYAEAVES
jgi:DNA-binding NtrC family response regulator